MDGTWDITLGTTVGTWVALSSVRNMSKVMNGGSPQSAAAHLEIRRIDANPVGDETMTSLYLRVRDENGV